MTEQIDAMQSITPNETAAKQAPKNDYSFTFATLEDVDALVTLHYKCFTEADHIAMEFGKRFIYSTYRWFVTSPGSFVVVAKQGENLVGFQSVSAFPYDGRMLLASRREAFIGLLSRPWLVFHPELLRRLFGLLLRRHKKILDHKKIGQLAFVGVDPGIQGKGIGKAIIKATVTICRERGMDELITGVLKHNTRSIAMLEGAGLVIAPELETKRYVYLRMNLAQSDPYMNGLSKKALETSASLRTGDQAN